ncbi:YncE family protein, partial [Frankia sp. Cas8]|uniref:YncE family protein n=1 Tax=unclassified Frankia TaxID=2632575 RepID=UPI003A10299C
MLALRANARKSFSSQCGEEKGRGRRFRPWAIPVIATGLVVLATPTQAMATPSDSPHAYVANFGSNTVSVINTDSNTVIDTILVGNRPAQVAITKGFDSRAYVTNFSSNNLSVIDT